MVGIPKNVDHKTGKEAKALFCIIEIFFFFSPFYIQIKKETLVCFLMLDASKDIFGLALCSSN